MGTAAGLLQARRGEMSRDGPPDEASGVELVDNANDDMADSQRSARICHDHISSNYPFNCWTASEIHQDAS